MLLPKYMIPFSSCPIDQSGELKYTSLKGLINGNNPLDNQSFWRIWIEGDKVYFQSFSHIYVYDHHTITPVDGPNAFLLLLKVRNEYWVQEMYGALYQLHNGILNKIPGSEFLNGTTTRVILPRCYFDYLRKGIERCYSEEC